MPLNFNTQRIKDTEEKGLPTQNAKSILVVW